MRFIGDIPRLNSKRHPDKKALIMGKECLTFGELNRQANRLAHGLMAIGVERGERVVILAYNCLDCVVINYGVAKCGGIVVPANFRYKKDELVYLINNSEPEVFLFGPEFFSLVEEAEPEFSKPVRLVAISGEPLASGITMMAAVTSVRHRSPREVVVAVTDGQLDFGPWEQIFYGEFDGKRRKRVLVKIIGE